MALTVTKTGYGVFRPQKPSKTGGIVGHIKSGLLMATGTFVFDNDYATGGESLAASDVGLSEILFITFSIVPSAGSSARGMSLNDIKYDYTNEKVLAMGPSACTATHEEVAECSGHSDLSAWTVRFVAFGHAYA